MFDNEDSLLRGTGPYRRGQATTILARRSRDIARVATPSPYLLRQYFSTQCNDDMLLRPLYTTSQNTMPIMVRDGHMNAMLQQPRKRMAWPVLPLRPQR